ncbi:uncharacterized protein J4E79_011629 [Alternaria viburni]|uniref:uncharacterized protein n=1 Tax=Alternaria viburni TaxID=566460 RepID=UPI0020C37195|nr:uncharacterized protein J4E79_011629 [Alternaria viburni]KAI4641858.1 hypothetical protein J4E79_011629 [Alternaria viburni]
MLGIPWDELTQTFQDAITISRKVGIPYVWIDSLCIVQDDQEDWAKEASRMASVYKYAYLVIAATSSKNGDDGSSMYNGRYLTAQSLNGKQRVLICLFWIELGVFKSDCSPPGYFTIPKAR